MAAEDVLRLAWYADRDGRRGRRDALVTLALAEGRSEDAGWVERARQWLLAVRPDHVFATFASLDRALADKHVAEAMSGLKHAYPPARVRTLLLRAAARRGRFNGRPASLSIILDDLFRPHRSEPPRIEHAAQRASTKAPATVPLLPSAPSNPFLPRDDAARSSVARDDGSSTDLVNFYLTLLLAMAVLLDSVIRPREQGSRAA